MYIDIVVAPAPVAQLFTGLYRIHLSCGTLPIGILYTMIGRLSAFIHAIIGSEFPSDLVLYIVTFTFIPVTLYF